MDIKIIDLTRYTSNNGVCVVKWKATKKDGQYQAIVGGSEVFHPNPSDENWKPFDELTEADVVLWLKNKKEWLKSTESRLNKSIEDQKNPPVLHGMPWSNSDAV